ncbi:MAG: ribosome biogenesis GTP-binding protein YihA/YsxC [Clostridia bacterium]|nr:ribosome biogenesis GTP-binding protein YihA/YsxC [Clostridia bacterium]
MNINKAVFEFSAGFKSQLPKSDLPEIVFSGKSNVGKSSLINKLLNRKAIARVSATPGKTQTINSFKLDTCRFIDLPGYGFAKVSDAEKKKWSDLIEGYFNQGRNIATVIQIVDIRHEPSVEDFNMINYLIERDLPFVIALTKADKLKVTKFNEQMEYFRNLFDEHEIKYFPVSSQNGKGIEELRAFIVSCAEE